MTSAKKEPAYTVYSTAGKYDVLPAAAQAILGEYVEDGSNHGKRIYRRKQTGSKTVPEVVLFFWDNRDGKDLSGWWFGDKIGGGQVWARNQSMAAVPPQSGWRCPVDGPVQKHVVCAPKAKGRKEGDGKRPHEAGDEAPHKRHQHSVTLVLAGGSEDLPTEALGLLGEYTQQGSNHGKKTFMKPGVQGGDSVWLYYWDSRDGRDFGGWWLGAAVGGELVYGRAEQHGNMPPVKGWRIPADGSKIDATMTVKGHDEEADMPEDERLQKVKDLVGSLETLLDKATDTAKSVLDGGGDVFEEGVRAVVQLLQARVHGLEDAKASAARHGKAAKKQKASNETEAELGLLEERLDSALGKAGKELARAREQLEKCEREGAEEHDKHAIEQSLPGAMEAVSSAEMAVENASTDEAAMKARDVVQAVRKQVDRLLEGARGYAPEAYKLACAEFKSLQNRCAAAEKRLALWEGSGLVQEDIMEDEEPAEEIVVDDSEGLVPLKGQKVELDPDVPEVELLKQMAAKVAAVEGEAKQALETASVVLKDGSSEQDARLSLDLLEEHLEAIKRAQSLLAQEVAAAQRRSVGEGTADAMRALNPRLQVVRSHVQQELVTAKRQVARAQRQAREERDLQAAEISMPLAMDSVTQAEEAVEEVVQEAGDLDWRRKQVEIALQYGDEYGDEIQKAMDLTQAAAEGAQDAIAAARTRLDAQIRAARLMPEDQQKAAFAEMAPVRKRLIEAQKKLNPYKKVRSEFEIQLKAKKELEGLTDRIGKVEVDIEGASSALSGATASEEDVRSVETSLGPIQTALAKALKLLDLKSKGLTGALAERLAAIQQRGLSAKAQLDELKEKARDERGQLVGSSLAQQAKAEVEDVERWLKKVEEAEKPWAGQGEVMAEDKAKPAIKKCEALVEEALPAVQAAKTTVMERLVEAKQLPEGLVRLETTESLQGLLARVDTIALKVTQLKIDTYSRKTKLQMTEVIEAVVKAEAESKKILKAAAPYSADNLETVEAAALKEVGAAISKCVPALQKVCEASRKVVTQKQQDPRNRTSPSFSTQLAKLAARLEAVENTCSGLQRAAKESEGNKKKLADQKKELARMEKLVSEVELVALPLGDEQPSEEAEEKTASTVRKVQAELDAWRGTAQELASNPHEAMKLAMEKLLEQSRTAQTRLDEAKTLVRGQIERAFARLFAKEAREETQSAAATFRKADEAEGPFLKGIENLSAQQTAAAVAACEAAAEKAQAALDKAQASVRAKQEEAAGFRCDDAASRARIAELNSHLKQLSSLGEKLHKFKEVTAGRKRSVPAGEVSEPPAKAAKTTASAQKRAKTAKA